MPLLPQPTGAHDAAIADPLSGPAAIEGDRPCRSGRLNPLLLTLLVGGAAVAGLVAVLPSGGSDVPEASERPLVMLVAAGMRAPVEAILAQYEAEYGVRVEPQYGGSNMLLNQLKINKFEQPDLYLAADAFYTSEAVREGLAGEVVPLARQYPMLVYRHDRELSIASWSDLFQADVRWSLGAADQAAIGRATKEYLETIESGDSNLWDRLEKQTTRYGVFKPTVNAVANDVKIGAVDVGIVWSTILASPDYRDHLTGLELTDLAETAKREPAGDTVTVSVLTGSARPTEALRLARYLGARDRGLAVFEAAGMTPVAGDDWAVMIEAACFCGAANRFDDNSLIRRLYRHFGSAREEPEFGGLRTLLFAQAGPF